MVQFVGSDSAAPPYNKLNIYSSQIKGIRKSNTMASCTRSGQIYGKDDRERYNVWNGRDVVEHVGRVLGVTKQEAGKQRRHWVYSAKGKCLLVVSISKNMWGLVLVHENGRVQQGQYVLRHKFHPQHSAFDGRHFYWDVYYPKTWDFMLGKSFAPYWTAIQPVQKFDGWHRKYWGMAGGGIGVMYDLSQIKWAPLAPPEGYPKETQAAVTRRQGKDAAATKDDE